MLTLERPHIISTLYINNVEDINAFGQYDELIVDAVVVPSPASFAVLFATCLTKLAPKLINLLENLSVNPNMII